MQAIAFAAYVAAMVGAAAALRHALPDDLRQAWERRE
jgi:hypothetical protein